MTRMAVTEQTAIIEHPEIRPQWVNTGYYIDLHEKVWSFYTQDGKIRLDPVSPSLSHLVKTVQASRKNEALKKSEDEVKANWNDVKANWNDTYGDF